MHKPFFQFFSVVSRDSKAVNFANLFFFFVDAYKVWFLAEIRWSVCMSKSYSGLCLSFSRTGAGLCIYHSFGGSNLNFLHISQWITLPTLSFLVLYSFCANLLHSLIINHAITLAWRKQNPDDTICKLKILHKLISKKKLKEKDRLKSFGLFENNQM